jgi:hypothetical protein
MSLLDVLDDRDRVTVIRKLFYRTAPVSDDLGPGAILGSYYQVILLSKYSFTGVIFASARDPWDMSTQ